ncbi:MAG TPA: DUF4139 domain-containing protein [Candidatus Eisenbacteria bacterium]|nr:DUF4139 domain-containing protein [Candidatus Eisenbacteria bacterium]
MIQSMAVLVGRPSLLVLACLLGLAVSGAPGYAQSKDAPAGDVAQSTEAGKQRDLSMSVYNDNLALVRDRRQFVIKSGISELRFTDVAATTEPTSVRLRPLGKRSIEVLSQDFRYDLATADRLLDRYLNREIEAVSTNDQIKHGTLLSYDGTSIVLRETPGTVLVMNRAEIRQIALREPAEGLITRPSLVWRIRSNGAGTEPLEVSYLASSISWRADYVATLEPNLKGLDLQGWASIENHSGTAFENTKLDLVAGSIHRASSPPMPMMDRGVAASQAKGGFEQFQERSFSEYHVYELPQRVTLGKDEVKQLGLLEAKAVRSTPRYVYDAQRDAQHVVSTVQFANSGGDLGVPIPQGLVRLYQKDKDNTLRLVGEDQVAHTAVRDTVRLTIGTAFDVTAERRQTDQRQVTPRVMESAVEIKLTNQKAESIDVSVVEHSWGDWTITDASHKWRKVDANTFEFVVRCPPGKPVTVTYRLQIQTGG